jgi:hypothetical protein
VLDVTTGEDARSACCKCIPGAPGFDESDEVRNPTEGWGDAVVKDLTSIVDSIESVYPALLNATKGSGRKRHAQKSKPVAKPIAQPKSDMPSGTIPVVSAVPIQEAEPIDSVPATPGSRRLLSVGKVIRTVPVPRLRVTSMAAIQVRDCVLVYACVYVYVCMCIRVLGKFSDCTCPSLACDVYGCDSGARFSVCVHVYTCMGEVFVLCLFLACV